MSPSERAVGVAAVGTRVAIIPYPRVLELARNGSASVGLVLGHVIAHELGHLLLQRATHSAAGLMRATLDLQLAQQGRLLFTAPEGQAIRAAIAGLDTCRTETTATTLVSVDFICVGASLVRLATRTRRVRATSQPKSALRRCETRLSCYWLVAMADKVSDDEVPSGLATC